MPQSQIKIRTASLDDARNIFLLIQNNIDQLVPRSTSDIVQNIDRFLVAELPDGEIGGVICYAFYPEIGEPTKSCVEIKSVCVRKDLRKLGLGRQLVKAQIERLRKFKPAQIVVLTFAPEFFEKLGFKKVPKETLMHKLYIGCINCTKHESPFTCPEIAMALTDL